MRLPILLALFALSFSGASGCATTVDTLESDVPASERAGEAEAAQEEEEAEGCPECVDNPGY